MKPVILILFLINIVFLKSNAQSVDFTFSTSSNLFCSPQAVTFTQNCTGNPDGFIWDFGNGIIGSSPSQTVTYLTPGSYTITLTATFANSALSTTKTIVINPTPTISVAADRNYICQPGNITFTATGSASITSYEWNFGDGSPVSTTASNTITHNYATYNSFTVTVRGITTASCNATATTNVQVTRFPITASISPSSGCIPSNSTLTATTTLPIGDANQSFVWTFGDGTPNATTGTNSTIHTYNIVTNITTASVAITTVQGCTNSFNFPTFAFGTPPFNTNAITVANRDTFCGSETIAFNATAVDANLYTWDFGDGTIQSTASNTINHKYQTLGNKQVIVIPTFNGCAGTPDTLNLYITGVIANYTFTNQCSSRNTFQYSNASLGTISKYYWSFSDNASIKDSVNYNTTHTFPTSGSFTSKLYVYDGVTGCSDSLITNQYTATPTLISTKPKVCRDSALYYVVNNSYNAAGGFTYNFFLAGATYTAGTSNAVTILPDTFGVFNDYVVISNPAGNTCNDTIYLGNTTTVAGPNTQFTTPVQQCIINSFPFNNTTTPFINTDTITNWNWHFGDSTFSSNQNPPPKIYSQPGNYTVSLTVTDKNNCKQKDSIAITVFPMPRIKALPQIDTLCLGQTATLYAFTTDTLLWTPNTNISCTTCDTTTVSPNFTTMYIAQATNSYGCRSYDTSLVKVYRPLNLAVLPFDTTVCPQQIVPLRINEQGVTVWSPATYLSSTTIPNPIATPDTTITYSVVVTDSVGCFADTATAIVRTHPRPTVNARPDTVVAYNSSFTLNPIYSPSVTSYLWSPSTNNLSCVTCPTPTGIARFTTTYTIAVSTAAGCKASDSITVIVSCDKANIYIPTAFTPNNDGVNDVFYPMTRGISMVSKFIVFNRWGQKVFEKVNFPPNVASFGWNGGFNGSNQIIDNQAYVWYFEGTCDQGQKINTKGTVVMIR